MELVKRYIAAVQRELPDTKRDEIGRELHANIMDQLDALQEQKGQLTDFDIAAVLKSMGHPRPTPYLWCWAYCFYCRLLIARLPGLAARWGCLAIYTAWPVASYKMYYWRSAVLRLRSG